jgi:hypothetical protein
MTRKQAIRIERDLKARGVYKPFVSTDGDLMYVESYPLTAIIRDGGCDPEMGPAQNIKITDCSLARTGQDSTITTARAFMCSGPNVIRLVAELLVSFHGPAHERAVQQDEN